MSYTSQYPPAQSDTYVKATSYNSANYYPHFTTDPTKSLTGTYNLNQWLAATGQTTNQRFHIDLGSAKIIKRIYYENSHISGGETDNGAKNFTLWGSNEADAFADLEFTHDIDWTQIGGSYQFDEHAGADQADPKYITVTNSTAYRYYAIKIADNWGDSNYLGIRRIELQTEDTVTLTIDDLSNSHQVSEPVLYSSIIISSLANNVQFEQVNLFSSVLLQNIEHIHQIESLSLTQQHSLIISDLNHSHPLSQAYVIPNIFGSGNDFSVDPRIIEVWRFENNLLAEKNGNDLSGSGAYESVSPLEGAYSLDCESTSLFRTDGDLSADFPLKNGDSVKKISLSFWIKPESLPSLGVIFTKFSSTASRRTIYISTTSGGDLKIAIYYNSGSSVEEWTAVSGLFVAGRKYHVGIAIDGLNKTGLVRVYDEYSGVANTYTHDFTNEMHISDGYLYIGGNVYLGYYDGLLDEMVVADELLSATEFDQIRQGIFGNDPNLFHDNQVESPAITQQHILSTSDLNNAHELDSINLSQQHNLIVNDADHSNAITSPLVQEQTDYSDDFTGSDGNPPDSSKWEIIAGSPEISSNRLREDTPGDDLRSVFYFEGDFDVQIDFDVTGTPETDSWNLVLKAYIDSTHQVYFGPAYYSSNKKYQRGYVNGGSWSYGAVDSRAQDSGKIRIVRTGNAFDVYYWNGSSWTQHGSSVTIGNINDRVYIGLLIGQWDGNPSATGYFDNFIINSGYAQGPPSAQAENLVHVHQAETLSLIQEHNLIVSDSSHSNQLGEPSVAQNIEVQELSHANEISAIGLDQKHILVVSNINNNNQLTSPFLTHIYNLTISDILHTHELENIVFGLISLIIANIAHNNNVESLELFGINNCNHDNIVDALSLIVTHLLLINDLSHDNAAEEITFAKRDDFIADGYVVISGTCIKDDPNAGTSDFAAYGQIDIGGQEYLVSGASYDTTYPDVSAMAAQGGPEISGGVDYESVLPSSFANEFVAAGSVAIVGAPAMDSAIPATATASEFIATGSILISGKCQRSTTEVDSSLITAFEAGGHIAVGGLRFMTVITTIPEIPVSAFEAGGQIEISGASALGPVTGPVLALAAHTGKGAAVLLVSSNCAVGFTTPQMSAFRAAGAILIVNPDVSLGETFETYALTGKAYEPAVWSGFDFNSYCIYRKQAYGAKENGIYLLEGDDDAGSPIHPGVRIGPHNYGRDQEKRLRSLRLGGNSNGAKVRIITGGGDEDTFDADRGRVPVSRDLQDREFTIEISDFEELSQVEIVPLLLFKR